MKNTGIIRKLDEVGRIIIPKEIREHLDIHNKDLIDIYVNAENIVLKKINPNCIFCGKNENLIKFKEKFICSSCITLIKR